MQFTGHFKCNLHLLMVFALINIEAQYMFCIKQCTVNNQMYCTLNNTSSMHQIHVEMQDTRFINTKRSNMTHIWRLDRQRGLCSYLHQMFQHKLSICDERIFHFSILLVELSSVQTIFIPHFPRNRNQ